MRIPRCILYGVTVLNTTVLSFIVRERFGDIGKEVGTWAELRLTGKAIQGLVRQTKAPRSPGQVNLPRRCGCCPWLGEAFRGFRSCRTLEGHIWPWMNLPLLVMVPQCVTKKDVDISCSLMARPVTVCL
jgi:hypothetical protein